MSRSLAEATRKGTPLLPWRRTLVGMLLAAAAAYASMTLDSSLPETPPFSPPRLEGQCSPTGILHDSGEPLDSTETVRMISNTVLRALVCESSVVNLVAEGTVARGVGARLAVHLGAQPLFDEPIDGTVELSLPARGPGWLIIAFNNDLYEPPADRNLTLRNLQIVPASVNEGP